LQIFLYRYRERREKDIKNQVDTHLITIATPFVAFFLLSLAQKQRFYTSKALLFAHKLNAFRVQ
jgi:hypothetical protein